MLIKSLRSEPEIFDPIIFEMGINIITGERTGGSKSDNKTNGVGKTRIINFIDFCLLSDYKKNRISRIPESIFHKDTFIILELYSLGNNITIYRNRVQENNPIIYKNGVPTKFSKLEDAKKYLSKCIFGDEYDLSFREMIRAFKRTEKSGYDKIDNPDGIASKDITPYLFLFDLSTDLYQRIEDKVKKLINAHD